MIDSQDRGPKPSRYLPLAGGNGVVTLSLVDAHALWTVLDTDKVRAARTSTLEPVIGSIQALHYAENEYLAFTREQSAAKTVNTAQDLDQTVSPKWIAEQDGVTRQTITRHARTGKIIGAHKDANGDWIITHAQYMHYRKYRSN